MKSSLNNFLSSLLNNPSNDKRFLKIPSQNEPIINKKSNLSESLETTKKENDLKKMPLFESTEIETFPFKQIAKPLLKEPLFKIWEDSLFLKSDLQQKYLKNKTHKNKQLMILSEKLEFINIKPIIVAKELLNLNINLIKNIHPIDLIKAENDNMNLWKRKNKMLENMIFLEINKNKKLIKYFLKVCECLKEFNDYDSLESCINGIIKNKLETKWFEEVKDFNKVYENHFELTKIIFHSENYSKTSPNYKSIGQLSEKGKSSENSVRQLEEKGKLARDFHEKTNLKEKPTGDLDKNNKQGNNLDKSRKGYEKHIESLDKNNKRENNLDKSRKGYEKHIESLDKNNKQENNLDKSRKGYEINSESLDKNNKRENKLDTIIKDDKKRTGDFNEKTNENSRKNQVDENSDKISDTKSDKSDVEQNDTDSFLTSPYSDINNENLQLNNKIETPTSEETNTKEVSIYLKIIPYNLLHKIISDLEKNPESQIAARNFCNALELISRIRNIKNISKKRVQHFLYKKMVDAGENKFRKSFEEYKEKDVGCFFLFM